MMATIGALTIAASFLYAPRCEHGPVLCGFRFITGLPCPGCGLTRSFCAIAQGRWLDAFAFHVLGPMLFAALVVGVPLLLYQGLTRRRVPLVQRVLFSTRTGWLMAGALFTHHLVRLVMMAWNGALWDGMHASAVAIAVAGIILGSIQGPRAPSPTGSGAVDGSKG